MRNQRGSILVATLAFVLGFTMLGFGSIYFATLQNEQAERQIGSTRAFWLAEAGSQTGLKQLDKLINTDLRTTLANASPSGVVAITRARVNDGDSVGWLIQSTRVNNVPVLTRNNDQAEFTETLTVSGTQSDGEFTYLIAITKKSDAVTIGFDSWELPFNFEIIALGETIGQERVVLVSGDFTIRVQQDNFAKYALFTNTHTTPSGTIVWFTPNTNFFGPVHSNTRFSFALNPGARFTQEVTQRESTARFSNRGNPLLLNADANGTIDVPRFDTGFTRGVEAVSLPTTSQQADMVQQATNGQAMPSSPGTVFVPNAGGVVTGGIVAVGDSTIRLSTDANNNAVYFISQGGAPKKITVDRTARQTIIEDTSNGTMEILNGLPHGQDNAGTLIYVNGSIASLSGQVQSETELTIASNNDIVITDHLRYSDYQPAVGSPGSPDYVAASADDTANLLGLVAWNGNVHVGTTAPDNIEIHSTIMAPNGVFQVDDYANQTRGSRGAATLIGGVITDFYGLFGQFNSAGQTISGYGRNFVYDDRMLRGRAPPYYPTLDKFIGFTDDILDDLEWSEG